MRSLSNPAYTEGKEKEVAVKILAYTFLGIGLLVLAWAGISAWLDESPLVIFLLIS